jgi:hypothetical protein
MQLPKSKHREAQAEADRPMHSLKSAPTFPRGIRTGNAHSGTSLIRDEKWNEQVFQKQDTVLKKKPAQHLIAEVPRRHARVEITIGIDLGDVWSHNCTLIWDNKRAFIRAWFAA